MALEIERKFLIRIPDQALLSAQPGMRRLEILQTYLLAEAGISARVRRLQEGDAVHYYHTEKRRISALTAAEAEEEISAADYTAHLAMADPARRPIEKRRYAIPYGGHILEIDIYPFWQDRAILEIELDDEGEDYCLPPYLTVLREVTADRRYKNAALALAVPMDALKEAEVPS